MKYKLYDNLKDLAIELIKTKDKYLKVMQDIDDTITQMQKIRENPYSETELKNGEQLCIKLNLNYAEIPIIISFLNNTLLFSRNSSKTTTYAEQTLTNLSICQKGIFAHVLLEESKIKKVTDIIEFIDD